MSRSVAVPLYVCLAAVVLGSAQGARAGAIAEGTFYQFSFGAALETATGCDPADPAGAFCTPSSGTPTVFLDAPPWTFTAPAEGALLTVVDAFLSGDQFELFDSHQSLGSTSVPGAPSDCGDDPLACDADPAMSQGVFALGPGAHSITLVPILSPGDGGSGYLRWVPVPEPGTMGLLLAGMLALARVGRRPRWLALALLFVLPSASCLPPTPASRFAGPTSSQPLALSANGDFLVAVNPDQDTVTFFDVRFDRNRRVAEVPVQDEPNGVAFLPTGSKAYVANTISGTVSVINVNIANGAVQRPHRHITVGTEPYGLALTPNGTKLYVSNARSNSVTVIDTATDTVIRTIPGVGIEPRGLAISNDGDADDVDETVYVTQFLSLPVAGKVDGADDAKSGRVTSISAATDAVLGTIVLQPIGDTGFKAAGDALARIPPGTTFTFTTGAYPNQLNNLALKGNFAYVPNTGASPNGPVRFDVNTQSLLHVLDRSTLLDANQTVNMHLAVQNQTNPVKRFVTVPWAIAFEHQADAGFVVSAASNILVKLLVNPSTGLAAVQVDPLDPTRVLQIPTGKNPRGIVVNAVDTRAYVMNYVSRDVTVVDLTTSREQVVGTMSSSSLPAPGTFADQIHVGKELYNTSVGEFDPPAIGQAPPSGRMSKDAWGACSTCHPFGLSDNVVWIFGDGPRRTIPQHTDFDPSDPLRLAQRMLNWSAARDEEEDFELNIRGVSGGAGLIVLTDGVTPDTNVVNLTPVASGGRNQVEVRGVPAWDALKAFVQFGIRAPISPVSKTDPQVIAGGALFRAANCQSCHGSALWTTSRVRFTPPPSAAAVVNGQIAGELRSVGTFDPTFVNEVRANAAAPLGGSGFVPPSLLSIFAFPGTFLHNGSVSSLDAVMQNVTHRSAGTGGVDTLSNASDRAAVVQFLLSIDGSTPPIGP